MGVVALIVAHGLWPDEFAVDSATVALVVVLVVVVLLPLLESASFPGGGGLVFRKKLEQLDQAAQQLTADEEAHETPEQPDDAEATARRAAQRRVADEVVAEVLEQADRSPRLALMLLSAELERAVHRLLMGTGWGDPGRRWSLRPALKRLVELEVIPRSAVSAADLFTQVRNAVVHGARARDDEILRAIDSGIQIYKAVAAAPRERNFVLAADVPLFADEGLATPIDDARGVLLRTVSSDSDSDESERIFPTTRDHFRVGEEVGWAWNHSRAWGPAWFRHPVTGEPMKAWDGSAEFVGSAIDDVLPRTLLQAPRGNGARSSPGAGHAPVDDRSGGNHRTGD